MTSSFKRENGSAGQTLHYSLLLGTHSFAGATMAAPFFSDRSCHRRHQRVPGTGVRCYTVKNGLSMRAFGLLIVILSLLLKRATAQEDLSCQTFTLDTVAIESNVRSVCEFDSCLWLEALEQNGTETGRCYQCSTQTTQDACEATGICLWIDGRDELGGSDCTLCAGRNQQECEATGYCFWDVEGFENVCSKCPGYTDSESCSAGGEYLCGPAFCAFHAIDADMLPLHFRLLLETHQGSRNVCQVWRIPHSKQLVSGQSQCQSETL